MRSLLAPLVLGLILSLATVFGVQWTLVRAAVQRVTESYIAEEFNNDADELFGALTVLPDTQTQLALLHFDPPYLRPYSGKYYQIMVADRVALRSPSLRDRVLDTPPIPRGQRRITHVAGPNDQLLLMTAVGYEFRGHPVTVAVAGNLKLIRAEFDRFLAHYREVSMVMFALLVVLQVGIVRLGLFPLRRVQAEVKQLEQGEVTQLSERVPSEVLPLVREVNRLLSLLVRRLQRSRESLGNLAHALKAPLTVLTHISEDLDLQRHTVLREQMAEQLKILRNRVESELRRARVAGQGASTAPVDLQSEIDSLATILRKLYRDRNLEITCSVPAGVKFAGDREDFLELCGNLMDNACKWAHAHVAVSVRNHSDIVLTVADDGPGCSEESLSRITRRGVRLDESTEGHGLGLSIATGIASSYGAEIRFGCSEQLGGFEAVVIFPKA